MKSDRPLISICICTFRRPQLLEGLLTAIFSGVNSPGDFEVVVVDNDIDRSARPVIEKFQTVGARLRTFVVPEQNISLARNRAVAEASGAWIAMIDDDEIPQSRWLVELFNCAVRMDADAVFGPVEPIYPADAPRWIVDGKFLQKRWMATGSAVSKGDARTSNVLIRSDVIKEVDGPFDPEFGLSGGEDALLFGGLLIEGRKFYWCDSGIVSEIIPSNRLTWQWLLRRSFRTGQTYGRLVLAGYGVYEPDAGEKLFYLFRSAVIGAVSLAAAVVSLPFGRTPSFKWLQKVATQIGKVSAFLPFVYREYASIP